MEAIIFVGVQGSGKTSFYRQHLLESHVRISLDMLRTRHREQLLLAACLQGKQPFVIDKTNPLPSDRARYQDMLSRLGQLDFGWWHTFSPHPCVTRFAETICVKESKRFRYRESQASFGNCKRQHCRKAS